MKSLIRKLDNIRFSLGCQLLRQRVKLSGNPRPSSYPYISGDSFRSVADHLYDETSGAIDVEMVREGDVIFVSTFLIDRFFQEVHPRIQVRYKLVTHNSDATVDERLVGYVDEKIIQWYAQNNTISHPKVVPIPIGLENLHYQANGIIRHFDELRQGGVAGRKKDRILFGFSIQTNRLEREPVHRLLASHRCADEIRTRLPGKRYLKTLSNYKFVASPPGHGMDTHRTWEAMYLGVVPIVKHSVATAYFHQRLGLPLWIVGEWRELESVDECCLRDKYEQMASEFDASPLFMDYWIRKVKGCNDQQLHRMANERWGDRDGDHQACYAPKCQEDTVDRVVLWNKDMSPID